MKMIKKIAFVTTFALICAWGVFASGKKDVEDTAKQSTEAVKEAAKDAVNDTVKSAEEAVKDGIDKAAEKAKDLTDGYNPDAK